MNAKRVFALALGLFLLGLAGLGQARQAKSDKEAIQGTWVVSDAVESGKKQDELLKGRFTFKDDKLSIKLVNEMNSTELTYALDPAKKPKEVDLKTGDKEKVQGIYELEGDALKLCVANLSTAKRPTEFKSDKDVVLITLTREKK